MKMDGRAWLVWAALAGVACGGRDARYAAPIGAPAPLGLERAVVLGDEALARLVVVKSPGEQRLHTHALTVGKNRRAMVAAPDGERVLVLSAGAEPRVDPSDEAPTLSLVDTSGEPTVVARYELPAAFSSMSVDPEGRWVVLSGGDDDFVTNPNQLVLIDLGDPDFEPVTKTIRSFGAAPERFRFSAPLSVPGGERRFLVVETRQDIALVALDDLTLPEVTIGLPLTPSGAPGKPADVVLHPGVAADDARLAVRLESDPNVVLVAFAPSDEAPLGFEPTLNLVDVGAPPAALEFVTTDARSSVADSGLRLAALVPARSQAALVDPATTRVERVALPGAFDRLRRVPAERITEAAGDVALLWSERLRTVALWSLGRTGSQAFRSVEALNLEVTVREVHDVPGDVFGHKKLLQSHDDRFFVLDLETRESFPMLASRALSLSVAPDGGRAWAFAPNGTQLAQIALDSLQPTSLRLAQPIQSLFDIATEDGDGRALVALHPGGALGATVLDARAPDVASSRFVPALLLGGSP